MQSTKEKKAKYHGVEYGSEVRQIKELAEYLIKIGYEKYDFFQHQAGLSRGAAEEYALQHTTNPTPEREDIDRIMENGLLVYPYATISETTKTIKYRYDNAFQLAEILYNYTYRDYCGDGEYKERVNVIIAFPKTIELMPDGEKRFDEQEATISVPFSRVIPMQDDCGNEYFPIDNVMYENNDWYVDPSFVLWVTCAGVGDARPATFFNERFLDELSPNEYNEKMKYWGALMKSHYGIHVPSKDAEENSLYTQYDTPHSATEKVVSGTLHCGAHNSHRDEEWYFEP